MKKQNSTKIIPRIGLTTTQANRSLLTQSTSSVKGSIEELKQQLKLRTAGRNGIEKQDLQEKPWSSQNNSARTVAFHSTTTQQQDGKEEQNELRMKILTEPVTATCRILIKLGSIPTIASFYEQDVLPRILIAIQHTLADIEDLQPEISLTGVEFGEPEDTDTEFSETETGDPEPSGIEDLDVEHGLEETHTSDIENTPPLYDEEPVDSIDLEETKEKDERHLLRQSTKKRKLE